LELPKELPLKLPLELPLEGRKATFKDSPAVRPKFIDPLIANILIKPSLVKCSLFFINSIGLRRTTAKRFKQFKIRSLLSYPPAEGGIFIKMRYYYF